jgi:hypothetical protein
MIKKNKLLRCITAVVSTAILLFVLGSPVFAADGPLKFNLTLDKAEYFSDEPINVVFSLKNSGANPVIVNQRFYISSSRPRPIKRKFILS